MGRPSEFQCVPGLRLESLERVHGLQVETLTERINRLETLMEKLEKRLWLTVYGVVAVILAQAFQGFLAVGQNALGS
jgi:hypothetical protein